jgi:hypothetical protein
MPLGGRCTRQFISAGLFLRSYFEIMGVARRRASESLRCRAGRGLGPEPPLQRLDGRMVRCGRGRCATGHCAVHGGRSVRAYGPFGKPWASPTHAPTVVFVRTAIQRSRYARYGGTVAGTGGTQVLEYIR